MFCSLAFTALTCGAAVAGQITARDLATLPKADVIFVGEVHDNPDHHRFQEEAVAALRPSAIVFEMLTPDQASAGKGAVGEAALREAYRWDESGWPDFSMYYPIIAAAGPVPVIGAGVDRETLVRVRGEGIEPVFGPSAARFGLTSPLPQDEQSRREAEQMASHCDALPETALPGMVFGQRVRDAMIARQALTALEETGGPVVVIAGSGHVRRDHGAPALLARAAPEVRLLTLGQIEEGHDEGDQPFDLWTVVPPAPRDDPCAAFR